MIRIGVIGYGYWGPNIVRNFSGNDGAEVVMLCDISQSALSRARSIYPNMKVTSDYREICDSPHIDAVAIVTQVSTHYDFAKKCLQNGKHVFVEKPLTANSRQAIELIELAEKKNLKIMVDHTFLFTGAVRKIKELMDEGALGNLYYYDSVRVNLGLFQRDVNVVWDLAPHDFSIMDYLIGAGGVAVSASGRSHVNGKEDVAYVTVYCVDDLIAHFNVNWLSPVKVRSTLIGGEKKMLVWNDVEPDEKIKVYDKGIEVKSTEGIYDLLVSYRSGDVWIPKIEQTEALKAETGYFIDCVTNNKEPINDGHAGLRVVRMLEACDRSLQKNGEIQTV